MLTLVCPAIAVFPVKKLCFVEIFRVRVSKNIFQININLHSEIFYEINGSEWHKVYHTHVPISFVMILHTTY